MTDIEVLDDPVDEEDFEYVYDPIGNRKTYYLPSGATRTYTRNSVNQYILMTSPTAVWQYDLDGNLDKDGKYKYVWDGENRLIEAATRKDLGANTQDYDAGDLKLTFKYDYLGRRVRKTAWTYNGSGWDEDSDLLFVYDGWNVITVLDANDDNAILRKYTWGLDLSGTLGGAGGIGGLLAVEETATTGSPSYWFFYDANGNASQIIDASDSSIAARYRYDPYGNIVGPDDDDDGDWRDDAGPYALANPYRFSTKWLDDELIHDTTWIQSAFGASGLYYYGYRYYSPQVGRSINRDPIQERGGANLYEFLTNNAINYHEPLGLCTVGDKFSETETVLVIGYMNPSDTTLVYTAFAVAEALALSVPPTSSSDPGDATIRLLELVSAMGRGGFCSIWSRTKTFECVGRCWLLRLFGYEPYWQKVADTGWVACTERLYDVQPYAGSTFGLLPEKWPDLMSLCDEKAKDRARDSLAE